LFAVLGSGHAVQGRWFYLKLKRRANENHEKNWAGKERKTKKAVKGV